MILFYSIINDENFNFCTIYNGGLSNPVDDFSFIAILCPCYSIHLEQAVFGVNHFYDFSFLNY